MRDRESIQRWNDDIIAEFRANQGKVGDKFEGAPILLLHTVGARSGLARINPMIYLPDGERMIVIASKWGSPGHPDWYHNLKAHPDVTVEGRSMVSGHGSSGRTVTPTPPGRRCASSPPAPAGPPG